MIVDQNIQENWAIVFCKKKQKNKKKTFASFL